MNRITTDDWKNWTRRAEQSDHVGASYQEMIADDAIPAPANMREETPAILDNVIDRARYFSADFHRRELETLWPRVWQMACREEEIPEAGDTVVYEIGRASFLIVRGNDDRIRAFRNTCRHRGTKLCTADTSVPKFVCPFHGFTWNLEGELIDVPMRWDFPHVSDNDTGLLEVASGVWGGFVFINPDGKAGPLEAFLSPIQEHFNGLLDYTGKYIATRYRKILPCNWKLGLEAFVESYHALETHPQAILFSNDENAQYDVLSRHISRFLIAVGMPSVQVAELFTDKAVMGAMAEANGLPDTPVLPEGMTPRTFMAEGVRAQLTAASGHDYSAVSEAELIDANQYSIFPNMVIFRSFSFPAIYRFRPNGDDPRSCIFDLVILRDLPKGEERPFPPAPIEIGDSTFHDAMKGYSPFLGLIYDQDVSNMKMQQEGMEAAPDAPLLASRYMEMRVKHIESVVDSYVAGAD